MENEQIAKAFGNVVRKLRTEKGYSQEGFAFEAGLHRTFMGVVEQGKRNVSMVTVFKIAAGLKITATELISATEKALNEPSIK